MSYRSFFILCTICLLTACESFDNFDKKDFFVKASPWQKEHLSNKAMAWEIDSVEAGLERHIFFSKEASSGGEQSAGGGCGCN